MKPGTVVPATRLVLTNAVWFKGTWKLQFDPKLTREAPFRLEGGGTKKKKMMQMSDIRFSYGEDERHQVLAMPYGDGDVQMVIVLPRDGVRLSDLERDLDAETFARWLDSMAPAEIDHVSIPRLELKLSYRLERTLAEMGMPLPLSPRADFSGMTGASDLYIDVIAHEAFVQVDEEGTEAAAATGVGMVLASAGQAEQRVFRADHPFLFAIHDRMTDTVLFLGRFMG